MQPVTQLDAPNWASALSQLRDEKLGPCLVFDLDRISRLTAGLRQAGRGLGVRFLAAMKALPFDSLVAVAASLEGLDISNGGEVARLLAWCTGGERIRYLSLTGPVIEAWPYPKAPVADRLTVNIENPRQLQIHNEVAQLAARTGFGARVAISPNRGATRFGIQPNELLQMTNLVARPDFDTLHCHVDGDAPMGADHSRSLRQLLDLADRLGDRVRYLNLGGGFRAETVEDVLRLCRDLRAATPPRIALLFEPGNWLIASGGFAIGHILSRQLRPELDATVIILDLSRECHLRWSTPLLVDWHGAAPATRKVLFFGPTCYEADFLGAFEWPGALATRTEPKESGTVVFRGVTGYSAAFNSGFNGIPPAQVYLYGDG